MFFNRTVGDMWEDKVILGRNKLQLFFSCYCVCYICHMSKLSKITQRIVSRQGTVTYKELEYLLGKFGYLEMTLGKTSGSRVAFVQPDTKHIIRLHKPHPGNELKAYQVKYIHTELQKQTLL